MFICMECGHKTPTHSRECPACCTEGSLVKKAVGAKASALIGKALGYDVTANSVSCHREENDDQGYVGVALVSFSVEKKVAKLLNLNFFNCALEEKKNEIYS